MLISEARRLFPAAGDRAYLNTATYGPASRLVVDAIRTFTTRWSEGSARFEEWEEAAEECRGLFAGLIRARPQDVAIQPYVSGSAGIIAGQLKPGQKVVVNDLEFTSNLWPWLYQQRRGVEVTVVANQAGRLSVERLAQAIGRQVDLVAISAVQSANGFRIALAELAALTHRAGGLLFVDAAQAVGGIEVDVGRDGFDLLACGSYKWLLGPRGSGYLFLSLQAQERYSPISVGWRAGRNPQSSYYGVEIELSETASRFDSSLSWLAVMGDLEALRLMSEIAPAAVEAHNLALAERFRSGIDSLGMHTDMFHPSERSPIVSIALEDAGATVARLRKRGVVVALRSAGARFSFHLFNDTSDVDRALEALAQDS